MSFANILHILWTFHLAEKPWFHVDHREESQIRGFAGWRMGTWYRHPAGLVWMTPGLWGYRTRIRTTSECTCVWRIMSQGRRKAFHVSWLSKVNSSILFFIFMPSPHLQCLGGPWCSGYGIGLVIERSRVRFLVTLLLGNDSGQAVQCSHPCASVTKQYN